MTLPDAQLQVTLSIRGEKLSMDLQKEIKKMETTTIRALEQGKSIAFRNTSKNARRGLRALQQDINKTLRKLENGYEEAIKGILTEIKDTAVDLTPIRTGNLRQSAFVATERLKTVVRGRVGYQIEHGPIPPGVTTNAPYAIFVHEGTGTMKGHSFLLEGFQQWEADIGNTLAEEIGKAL